MKKKIVKCLCHLMIAAVVVSGVSVNASAMEKEEAVVLECAEETEETAISENIGEAELEETTILENAEETDSEQDSISENAETESEEEKEAEGLAAEETTEETNNEESTETETSVKEESTVVYEGEVTVYETNVTLTEDTTIEGDLVIKSGAVLNLNNKSLTVNGNVTVQDDSELNVEGSILSIFGNLDINDTASLCSNGDTIINIENDFIWNSQSNRLMAHYVAYGVMNLKGTYTDKIGKYFNGTLNLCGGAGQKLQFEQAGYINKLTTNGQVIEADVLYVESIGTDITVKSSTGTVKMPKNFNANENKVTIDGNLTVENNADLDVQSSTLNINGNLEMNNTASLCSNGGTIINIERDFIWNSQSDRLMAHYVAYGIMNLKGNYIDKIGKYFNGTLNLCGGEGQKLQFEQAGYINKLTTNGQAIEADVLYVESIGTDITVKSTTGTVKMPKSFNANENKVTIDGNLTVENNADLDVQSSTLHVNGNLEMNDTTSLCSNGGTIINVEKDFTWNSQGGRLMAHYVAYGIMNLKGNYIDKIGKYFNGTLNLCGEEGQKLQFEQAGYINKLTTNGQVIEADILYVENIGTDITVKSSTGTVRMPKNFNANENKVTIDGNLTVENNADLDVQSSTLHVNGNLEMNDTTSLCSNGGTIINVEKDFTWNSQGGRLMAQYVAYGVMNLKGNYTDNIGKKFNGTLKVLSEGTKITSKNGSISKLVLSAPQEEYEITGLNLENTKIEAQLPKDTEVAVKQKYDVSAYYKGLTIKKYVVTSVDGFGKATVSKKGILIGKKAGKVSIKPLLTNGKYGTEMTFVITKPAFTTKKIYTTYIGQSVSANELLIDVPSNNNIVWTVSGKNPVADVDANGKLVIRRFGSGKLTAAITNKQNQIVKVSVSISAKQPKFSIKDGTKIKATKTKTVILKNVPKGRDVKWTSSDENIIKVIPDAVNPSKVKLLAGTSDGVTISPAEIKAVVDGQTYTVNVFVK